jgi:hypothetical protein
MLLESVAEDPASGDADQAFARLMAVIVARVASQQAALEDESALRESLQSQLDELKALEERLNAAELAP